MRVSERILIKLINISIAEAEQYWLEKYGKKLFVVCGNRIEWARDYVKITIKGASRREDIEKSKVFYNWYIKKIIDDNPVLKSDYLLRLIDSPETLQGWHE